MLTNPYLLGYIVLIMLLYMAGSGLKRMSQEQRDRNRERQREDARKDLRCPHCGQRICIEIKDSSGKPPDG